MPKERDEDRLLSSSQAAERLGVKPATLYAYVSRGLLRSEPGDDHRSRLYRRADVEALKAKRSERLDPSRISRRALNWGRPVLDSSITLIEDGRLYYRGLDVERLARRHSLEEVAGLIWCGSLEQGPPLFEHEPGEVQPSWMRLLRAAEPAHPGDGLQILLRLAAADDVAALDVRPGSVQRCGARLLRRMIAVTAGVRNRPTGEALVAPLVRSWCSAADAREEDCARLLNGALILCADHELNVSSFTARCVASAGSSPYEAVTAGMAALRGFRHGGHSDWVEALLRELAADRSRAPDRRRIRRRLGERLARGERLLGFGQPLYPQGDPRYRILASLLDAAFPSSFVLRTARCVAEEGRKLVQHEPNIDFALATLSVQLGLESGGAWTVFALGRTIGWLGHAIEEYGRGRLIRPRARYTGPEPVGRQASDAVAEL